MNSSPKSEIEKVLANQMPSRFVYAPNYWQWFAHQKNHNLLPGEIRHCSSLSDLYNHLGVDIFSRNVYSDPEKYWFGGICEEYFEDFEVIEESHYDRRDKVVRKEYRSPAGSLSEELAYMYNESTLVQKQFLVTDYVNQYDVFSHFVRARKWRLNKEKYDTISQSLGDRGMVIAGEFFSPLKMLHFAMGPINAVYFLMECPDQAKALLDWHENAMINCLKECIGYGVRVVMSMDNLDTMFHPPDYVREYSRSFYEKAGAICHKADAKFFVHACGQQKQNLGLISSCHVDGLEGVAFPPLGDVWLDEAMTLTSSGFIITGGISAMETRDLKSRAEIFHYVEELFRKMLPYKNRFIFSSSCNTAIDTSWETILHFRDAWLQFRDM